MLEIKYHKKGLTFRPTQSEKNINLINEQSIYPTDLF